MVLLLLYDSNIMVAILFCNSSVGCFLFLVQVHCKNYRGHDCVLPYWNYQDFYQQPITTSTELQVKEHEQT